MNALAPIGRLFFSAIFIISGVNHFVQINEMTAHAQNLGLPFPRLAILGSGALLVVCGGGVLLGVLARLSAALIALFLVTAALVVHRFWAFEDPQMAQTQFVQFLKNLSMAGGALILTYFGPGPFSLRERRAAEGPRPGYVFRFRQRPQE